LKDKNPLPDVVFIDGGLGQLNQAIMVMDSIGVESIQLVGVKTA
jgi:excinuclease ABC subunit C